MVRRGSTVRVRQRAYERPANGPFCCLDGLRTSLGASLNLSPGSVPNIARGLEAWLKQRRLTSSSTSINGRYPQPKVVRTSTHRTPTVRRCEAGRGRPFRVVERELARAHVLRLECSGRWPTRRLCPVIFSRRGSVGQLRGPPFGRDDPHRELERAPVERLRELRDRDKIVA